MSYWVIELDVEDKAITRVNHSYTKVVRIIVIKNVVKGSSFGLVASSTFLEKKVLFRLSYDV